MADIGRLLGRVGSGFFQQAWVVADLEAAKQAMRTTLGCGDFVDLPTGDAEYELRGETVSCALLLGFARTGNVQIELIQPVRGAGVHTEFLERFGPGAHHLGFLTDDLDRELEAARRDGFLPVMAGNFGPLRLCYLDTFDTLGLYVELIQDPEGMISAMMPWRD